MGVSGSRLQHAVAIEGQNMWRSGPCAARGESTLGAPQYGYITLEDNYSRDTGARRKMNVSSRTCSS